MQDPTIYSYYDLLCLIYTPPIANRILTVQSFSDFFDIPDLIPLTDISGSITDITAPWRWFRSSTKNGYIHEETTFRLLLSCDLYDKYDCMTGGTIVEECIISHSDAVLDFDLGRVEAALSPDAPSHPFADPAFLDVSNAPNVPFQLPTPRSSTNPDPIPSFLQPIFDEPQIVPAPQFDYRDFYDHSTFVSSTDLSSSPRPVHSTFDLNDFLADFTDEIFGCGCEPSSTTPSVPDLSIPVSTFISVNYNSDFSIASAYGSPDPITCDSESDSAQSFLIMTNASTVAMVTHEELSPVGSHSACHVTSCGLTDCPNSYTSIPIIPHSPYDRSFLCQFKPSLTTLTNVTLTVTDLDGPQMSTVLVVPSIPFINFSNVWHVTDFDISSTHFNHKHILFEPRPYISEYPLYAMMPEHYSVTLSHLVSYLLNSSPGLAMPDPPVFYDPSIHSTQSKYRSLIRQRYFQIFETKLLVDQFFKVFQAEINDVTTVVVQLRDPCTIGPWDAWKGSYHSLPGERPSTLFLRIYMFLHFLMLYHNKKFSLRPLVSVPRLEYYRFLKVYVSEFLLMDSLMGGGNFVIDVPG